MNKGVIGTVCFVIGGVAGYFVAKKAMNEECEQRIQEEVANVKAAFKSGMKGDRAKAFERVVNAKKAEGEDTASVYKSAIRQSYRPETKSEQQLHEMAEKLRPHVISPDEYGEKAGYDQISLICYADGTVANDEELAMTDEQIENDVGKESLNHFGEYEEDSVFVRNDAQRVDYEILKDMRTYSEVLKEKPYLRNQRND